jgi:hypothetical protein
MKTNKVVAVVLGVFIFLSVIVIKDNQKNNTNSLKVGPYYLSQK